jgi:hypothetical protein
VSEWDKEGTTERERESERERENLNVGISLLLEKVGHHVVPPGHPSIQRFTSDFYFLYR